MKNEYNWKNAEQRIEAEDRPWQDPYVLNYLYYEQGKSTTEAADILGCSSSTVSNWLHRTGLGTRDRINALRESGATFTRSGPYEMVSANNGDRSSCALVHQLVVIANGEDPHVVFEDSTIIHHRDNIPWDNRPVNLEVMDQEQHRRLHQDGDWREELDDEVIGYV